MCFGMAGKILLFSDGQTLFHNFIDCAEVASCIRDVRMKDEKNEVADQPGKVVRI